MDLNLIQTFLVVAEFQSYTKAAEQLGLTQPAVSAAAFLERGDRKIILLYKECNTSYVDFSDSPNCFVNLNTPEELAQFGQLES